MAYIVYNTLEIILGMNKTIYNKMYGYFVIVVEFSQIIGNSFRIFSLPMIGTRSFLDCLKLKMDWNFSRLLSEGPTECSYIYFSKYLRLFDIIYIINNLKPTIYHI